MKKIGLLIVIFLHLWFNIASAADERNQMIEEQYQVSGAQAVEDTANQLISQETKEIIQNFDFGSVTKELSGGKFEINAGSLFSRILRFFMKEVYLNIKIMIQLIVLSIMCGLLTNLQSSFGREGIGEIAFFTCYIFLTAIFVQSFSSVIRIGSEVIDSMVIFMQSMLPTLMTLLISTGNITSASMFQPIVIFSVQMIAGIVKNLLLPLLLCATSLAIISNVSDKFHISKLVGLLKQMVKWSLGMVLTGFIGVITVQGLTASVVDGVGTKTAKFAVGNFIPVVGGILSDAVDTVIGCSLILKNAVGVAGLMVILLICMVPIIKIAALIGIYRITAAVIEPVSDNRIIQCIGDLASSITYVFAMVVSVAVLFLLSITIIIGAGNLSAMLR